MRDGSTRQKPPRAQHVTWTPDHIQVDDLRLHGRLEDLRVYTAGARGLTWSRALVHALLEELHVNEEFEDLVARVPRGRASQFPRLVAIALLLRHSCVREISKRRPSGLA